MNCWLEHENILNEVKMVWTESSVNGKVSYVAKEKLKKLKKHLRIWNKEVFGILDLKIDNIVAELNELDLMVSNDPVVHAENS